MKVYNEIIKFDDNRRAITIGAFDGIHNGHKLLINKTIYIARKYKIKSTVITFNQESVDNLLKNSSTFLISSKQKLKILEQMGIDEVFNLKFDKSIMNTSSDDFLALLKMNLNINYLVLGFDAKIGSDQRNVYQIDEYCKDNKIKLYITPEFSIKNEKVSSTKIKNLIKQGIIGEELIKNLGREYGIRGKIIHGDNIGKKTFGFPTANIEPDFPYVLPKNGVYYCKIKINRSAFYDAAVNIGNKPTIKNKKSNFTVEAFIYGFDNNIYNENIELIFKKFIREEKKFNSYNELKKQIELDVKKIRNYIDKK